MLLGPKFIIQVCSQRWSVLMVWAFTPSRDRRVYVSPVTITLRPVLLTVLCSRFHTKKVHGTYYSDRASAHKDWLVWRPVLVKINIIKWRHKWLFCSLCTAAPPLKKIGKELLSDFFEGRGGCTQATFLASAAFIMDPLCIFVITKQDFFSVLLIFFSGVNYFFINAVSFFYVVVWINFSCVPQTIF